MEPLAVQSTPGLVRPTLDLQSDLSAVLREGRVLAGEVLQTLDGGTLLIGVGRHRVPAQAPAQLQTRLRPGDTFLFRVQVEGDGLVLSVLDRPEGLEPRLLRALRSAAGASGALGRLLSELVTALGVELSGGGPQAPDEAALALGRGLLGHAFRPGAGGAELGRALALGGVGYEARLAEAALAGLSPRAAAALGRELVGLLVAELVQGAAGREAGTFESQLRAALLAELGGGDGHPGLRGLLSAALWALASDEAEGLQLQARLARALPAGLGAALEDLLLRALLGSGAGGDRTEAADALLAEARLDLKGALLRALAELGDGPARTAVARALEGIENEQLLNVARARSGDAFHFPLPVLDGQRWTTAHVFVRRGSKDGGDGQGEPEGVHRLTIAVTFLHTGPVRAELAVRPGSLAARVAVGRPEVLERMQARSGELEARLALGGRRVSLALVLAPPEQLDGERERSDIRFLREHHLMDRSG